MTTPHRPDFQQPDLGRPGPQGHTEPPADHLDPAPPEQQYAAPAVTRQVQPRPPRDQPVVTWVLIAVCVAVWVGEFTRPELLDQVVLTAEIGREQPWRFVTSAFAHAPNLAHIMFNMYALWVLGRSLEPFLGRARFLTCYLVSALAAGVCFVAMATPGGDGAFLPGWNDGVVGASGAVFGLFGVLLVVQRRLGQSTRSLLIVLGINMALLLVVPGIAWQAHLGGFLAGLVSGVIFFDDPIRVQRGQSPRTWPRMALLTAAVVAVLVAKYALM